MADENIRSVDAREAGGADLSTWVDEAQARQLASEGQHDAAYAAFMSVFRRDGRLNDYQPLLGLVERASRVDFDEVRAVVDVARRDAPRDPLLSALLGNFYYLDNSLTEALIEFDAAIAAIGPLDQVPSWILLRKLGILSALGMDVAARTWYSRIRAFLSDPEHAAAAAKLVEEGESTDAAATGQTNSKSTRELAGGSVGSMDPEAREVALESELSMLQLHHLQAEVERLFEANLRMQTTIDALKHELSAANEQLATVRAEMALHRADQVGH